MCLSWLVPWASEAQFQLGLSPQPCRMHLRIAPVTFSRTLSTDCHLSFVETCKHRHWFPNAVGLYLWCWANFLGIKERSEAKKVESHHSRHLRWNCLSHLTLNRVRRWWYAVLVTTNDCYTGLHVFLCAWPVPSPLQILFVLCSVPKPLNPKHPLLPL